MAKPPGNFPIEGLSSNVFTVHMYSAKHITDDKDEEAFGVKFANTIMPDLLSVLGDTFAILLKPIEYQPYNFTLQVSRDTYEWLWTFAEDITPVLLKHDIKVLKIFIPSCACHLRPAYYISALAQDGAYIEKKVHVPKIVMKVLSETIGSICEGREFPVYMTQTRDF
jgi:hypothetical protein